MIGASTVPVGSPEEKEVLFRPLTKSNVAFCSLQASGKAVVLPILALKEQIGQGRRP